MKTVVRYLRNLATDGLSDGQLLETFLANRDEVAFEALLRRYGPMVLGVCRRVLRNPHDAEDAFQATFLVLVRKAASIQPPGLVGNWLYGVASRTARKARALNVLRRAKERQSLLASQTVDAFDLDRREMLHYLDAELGRLPEKYRVPLVLCELEGASRREAARLLGLPEGTLSWRLAWGRKLLARKLARRGIMVSAAVLAEALSSTASAAVSSELLTSTGKAAMRFAEGQSLTAAAASTQILTLTEGVLRAMLLSKFKIVWVLALAATVGLGMSALAYRGNAAGTDQPKAGSQQTRASTDEMDELRLEIEALRRGLQATRERVKSLESEVQTLKLAKSTVGQPNNVPPVPGAGGYPIALDMRAPAAFSGVMPSNTPPPTGLPGVPSTTGPASMPGIPSATAPANALPGIPSAMGPGNGPAGMPSMALPGGSGFMPGGSLPTSGVIHAPGTAGMMPGMPGMSGMMPGGPGQIAPSQPGSRPAQGPSSGDPRKARTPSQRQTTDDPLAAAESALKQLRKDPGNAEAKDRLERALRQWKRQTETDNRVPQ
jgi:RNA polymerase sigma-70 factor (ECF subfamily)